MRPRVPFTHIPPLALRYTVRFRSRYSIRTTTSFPLCTAFFTRSYSLSNAAVEWISVPNTTRSSPSTPTASAYDWTMDDRHVEGLALVGGGFCLHLRIWPADVHANRCAHAYRVLPSGDDLPWCGNGYHGHCAHVVATRSGA